MYGIFRLGGTFFFFFLVSGIFLWGVRKIFFLVSGFFLGGRNFWLSGVFWVVGVRVLVFMLQGLGLERASRRLPGEQKKSGPGTALPPTYIYFIDDKYS